MRAMPTFTRKQICIFSLIVVRVVLSASTQEQFEEAAPTNVDADAVMQSVPAEAETEANADIISEEGTHGVEEMEQDAYLEIEQSADNDMTNEEGELSPEQEPLSDKALTALHKLIDNDGDGKISSKEVMDMSWKVINERAKRDIPNILDTIGASTEGTLTLKEHLDDIRIQNLDMDENESVATAKLDFEESKFRAADASGDYKLTGDELISLYHPYTNRKVFALLLADTIKTKDQNGDGVLDMVEALGEEEEELFAQLDVDKDGVLNDNELFKLESGVIHDENGVKQLYEIADKDKDGLVSLGELLSANGELTDGTDAKFQLHDWIEHHELTQEL